VGHRGEGLDAGGAQDFQAFDISGGEQGKAEDAAGGGADGLGVPLADGSGKEDGAGGVKGFSGAKDGAEVAGILDAAENDDQGRGGGEQARPLPLAGTHQGGDGLGCFGGCGGVEEIARKGEDFGGFEEIELGEGRLGEEGFVAESDKDSDDFDTCEGGFLKEMEAFQAHDTGGRGAMLAEGVAKLLQASVPLTLYNAYSHLLEPHDLTRLYRVGCW